MKMEKVRWDVGRDEVIVEGLVEGIREEKGETLKR